MLAYSAKNRSASIRIPYTVGEKAKRIETRFPGDIDGRGTFQR
jgi:glutamine synthetase